MVTRVQNARKKRLSIATQLRAVIYARVSKPGEKSVQDQERVGRRDLESVGAVVVAVFTDKQSASRYRRVQDRPGFVQTKEFIRAGHADLLWTFANNRAHRDLDDYVPLRRLCIETDTLWRYGGRTYDLSKPADRRAANADAVRAEEFGDDLSEAINRGIQEALEAGRAHGKLPRGYRIIRDDRTGRPIRREPVPEQAALIREAAERVLAGEALLSVGRSLTPRWEAVGGRGKLLPPQTLRQMLINPTYAGLRTYQGKVVREGDWEPVFSVETHERLCLRLKDPARRTHRGTEPRYLSSYVAICGVCGLRVTPKKAKNRMMTYRCNAGHVSRHLESVDAFVEEALLRMLESPQAVAKIMAAEQETADGPSLEQEWDEIARLREGMKEWVREAARSGVSVSSVLAYEETVNEQIKEVERRIALRTSDPLLTRAVGPDARRLWEALSVPERRDVLRRVMRVVIMPMREAVDPLGVEIYPVGAFADAGLLPA
ncbi:recombinase family protein [Nocardia farcinica]|uniref:recombinase family protein n=1 Tax=Nocardia farcinica TaxID=37329 RepID=UPI0018962919|nr:recombinase family protein [Nocardia farcinica]MBF6411010.1 recombinase family protein [Nocardia farcinica]